MIRSLVAAGAVLLAASAGAAQKPTSALETMPRVLNAGEVQRAIARAYPRDLLREGHGGRVHLSLVVEVDSTPSAIAVHESSGFVGLDTTAVALASKLRFLPAAVNGRPVRVRVVLPLDFTAPHPSPRRRRFLGIF